VLSPCMVLSAVVHMLLLLPLLLLLLLLGVRSC
jgi:hypothetical protein